MMRNVIVAFIASLFLTSIAASAAETYQIDPQHSYVMYRISHLGFSIQSGKWFVQGTIQLDKDNPEKSKVTATIPLANVDTGIAALDEHLKGPLFFDVARYPTATFVSNKIQVISKTSAIISGTLSLHGYSLPVTLHTKFNKMGINEITNKMTVGFSAKAHLNRSDFGITTLAPKLGNPVEINIEVEAYKADATKS